MSARRRSSSAVRPSCGASATPKLARTSTAGASSREKGPSSASPRRRAIATAAWPLRDAREHDRELVAAQAGERLVRRQRPGQAPGDGAQQVVALVVAERVVDVLEAVEVDEDDRERAAVAVARRERLLEPVAQQGAVGQAGERVVERVVLVLDGAAAGPVEREERQAEQRQRRERELRGDDHDRAEAEQDAHGRGLHLQVRAEVPEEVRVLGQRDGAGDQEGIDEEEDHGGRHGGGEVARGERVVAAVEAAEPP